MSQVHLYLGCTCRSVTTVELWGRCSGVAAQKVSFTHKSLIYLLHIYGQSLCYLHSLVSNQVSPILGHWTWRDGDITADALILLDELLFRYKYLLVYTDMLLELDLSFCGQLKKEENLGLKFRPWDKTVSTEQIIQEGSRASWETRLTNLMLGGKSIWTLNYWSASAIF